MIRRSLVIVNVNDWLINAYGMRTWAFASLDEEFRNDCDTNKCLRAECIAALRLGVQNVISSSIIFHASMLLVIYTIADVYSAA